MMAKEMIRGGYQIGKDLGQNLQGILETTELFGKKDTFGLKFQPTAKDKKKMQAHKKVENEGKQIAMSVRQLHYIFPRPSGVILSELDEECPIEEIEMGLSQLFVGVTYKDEPPEEMEFPTNSKEAIQNWPADYLPSRKKFW